MRCMTRLPLLLDDDLVVALAGLEGDQAMPGLLDPLGDVRLGALVAGLVFILDQATKLWLYHVVDIGARPPIAVTGFFDLMLVWNRGVSYGLFQQEGAIGPWVLVVLSLAAAVGLSIWLSRTTSGFVGVALGFAINTFWDGVPLGLAVGAAVVGIVVAATRNRDVFCQQSRSMCGRCRRPARPASGGDRRP